MEPDGNWKLVHITNSSEPEAVGDEWPVFTDSWDDETKLSTIEFPETSIFISEFSPRETDTKTDMEMETEPNGNRKPIHMRDSSEPQDFCAKRPKFTDSKEELSVEIPSVEIISKLSPRDFTSTGKCTSVRDKNKRWRMAFSQIAPSVVSVSTFLGVERKLDCSGLIIEWDAAEKEATILTSAKVLRTPNNVEVGGLKIHVIVRLADGRQLLGRPDFVDYYHNILSLKVKATTSLAAVDLRSRLAPVVHGMEVIVLGREFFTCGLCDDTGVLFLESPYFGCDELLRSTCRVSPVSEGGPVITDDGCVVGIDFLDNYVYGHTLPSPIIISSLDLWKMHRFVVQPWFGLSAVNTDELPPDVWEQYGELPDVSFVAVRKVYKGSPAQENGVRPGDRIISCNRINIKTVEQFSQLLLERSRHLAKDSDQSFLVVVKPIDRVANDITIEADNLVVADKKLLCCWPSIDAQWYSKKLGSDENTWTLPPSVSLVSYPSPPWLPPRV